MSLGTVVFDDGRVILPIEAIWLDHRHVCIKVTMTADIVFDGTVEQAYAIHDQQGGVVCLCALPPVGHKPAGSRWEFTLQMHMIDNESAGFQRLQKARARR